VLANDLTVTSRHMVERAVRELAVDGFVLKPNQVGSITGAMDAFDLATSHDLLAIPSGRSGGVIDDIVMDLCRTWGSVPEERCASFRRADREAELPAAAADDIGSNRMADLTNVVRFN
jgi:enolase